MNDEFAFIGKITPDITYGTSLEKGIGDDAAVYKGSDKMDEVVCVDTMVEGVHFKRETLSPFQIGKRALAVNVSDLAAMGAIPTYYLVSLAVPADWKEEELLDIYRGMDTLAKRYKMDLIGGDTVAASTLVLTVTAIGRVERGRALYRNAAKAGDVVFLTGDVGSSAAGLSLLLQRGRTGQFNIDEEYLIKRHQEPVPHVQQGRLLSMFQERVTLNDVSDGVASEANELAEASRVKITLHKAAIPFHQSMCAYPREKQLEWALFGGEDFVLIGTVAVEHVNLLKEKFSAIDKPFHVIGTVEEGEPGVFLQEGNEMTPVGKNGYNHFNIIQQKSPTSISGEVNASSLTVQRGYKPRLNKLKPPADATDF